MEGWESSIDEAITRLDSMLGSRKTGSHLGLDITGLREQIRILSKKQRNIHLLCVKEQLNVENLSNEVNEVSTQLAHETAERQALTESLQDLRLEAEYWQEHVQSVQQQVSASRVGLDSAKEQLKQNYMKVREFERLFEQTSLQLARINAKSADDIHQRDLVKKRISDIQHSLDVTESKHHLNSGSGDYDCTAIEESVAAEIARNKETAFRMAEVNKQLEHRLAEVSDEPQKLKRLLRTCTAMLNEKKALLQHQQQSSLVDTSLNEQ